MLKVLLLYEYQGQTELVYLVSKTLTQKVFDGLKIISCWGTFNCIFTAGWLRCCEPTSYAALTSPAYLARSICASPDRSEPAIRRRRDSDRLAIRRCRGGRISWQQLRLFSIKCEKEQSKFYPIDQLYPAEINIRWSKYWNKRSLHKKNN